MKNLFRKLSCIALLLIGIALCGWEFGSIAIPRAGVCIAILLAAIISALPLVQRLLERFKQITPSRRRIITIAIWIISSSYLTFTAFNQHRPTYPRSHDEQSYLLQMRMLSQGKLWTTAHPLADFFETFYVHVKPVYASMYFPGTAIAYVWEIWLDSSHWLGPIVLAGLCVALMFRIVTELSDDALLGLTGAVVLLGIRWFRYLSFIVLSHLVIIALGLLIVYAYLKWRRKQRWPWALVLGALIGWAAITRPLDALCYSAPVIVVVLWELWGKSRQHIAQTITLIVVAALPFATVQLIFDKGVTGSYLRTPFQQYISTFSPGMEYAGTGAPQIGKPQTRLMQKIVLHETMLKPAIERAEHERFGGWFDWKWRELLDGIMPSLLLLILLPPALLAMFRGRRWVLWAMLPLYMIGYSYFPFMLGQYKPIAAPGMIMLCLCGVEGIFQTLPGGRFWRCFGCFTLMILSVGTLYEFSHRKDDPIENNFMRFVAEEMPKAVKSPAVVLFTYDPFVDNAMEEPVYNLDAVNPDDQAIIRAHDLGQEDRKLFAYYARRQPGRMIYQFRRKELKIVPLGTAKELAEKYPVTQRAQ